LRRWRLRNFKSVPEAEVEFKPLTVLVGANSSGKSSLIQSILLMVQAAQSYSTDATLPLNGKFAELGDFGDVRFAGASSRERVGIGGTVCLASGPVSPPDDSLTQTSELFEWDFDLLNTGADDPPGRAHLRRVWFSMPMLEDTAGGTDDGVAEFEATRLTRKTRTVMTVSKTAAFQPVHIEGSLRLKSGDEERRPIAVSGFTHRAGVPQSFLVRSDRYAILGAEWVKRTRHALRDRRRNPRTDWERIRDRRQGAAPSVDRSDPYMNELATAACDRLIEAIVEAVRSESEPSSGGGGTRDRVLRHLEACRTEAIDEGFWRQLHSLVNDAKFSRAIERSLGRGEPVLLPADEIDRTRTAAQTLESQGNRLAGLFGSGVLYLGPLRQDPQVLYTAVPTEQPGFVGRKGEFAIAMLHKNASQEVVCPLGDGSSRSMPLRKAVNHWLERFGLAESIETLYRPRLGLEPKIEMQDVSRPLDMTAVGVGVSQLLPVLIMGLHSDPGSVLLIEQPELHLHPAMQQMLGDFLLACVRSGRQVIVETHSDHLVTRLRRRIAEDPRDTVFRQVGFVFAERFDGSTRFLHIEPNRYGGFEEWPKGFFEESTLDSQCLVKAGLGKRGDGTP
jgi:predicted ATPase